MTSEPICEDCDDTGLVDCPDCYGTGVVQKSRQKKDYNVKVVEVPCSKCVNITGKVTCKCS